jgi:hypothetical protein
MLVPRKRNYFTKPPDRAAGASWSGGSVIFLTEPLIMPVFVQMVKGINHTFFRGLRESTWMNPNPEEALGSRTLGIPEKHARESSLRGIRRMSM